MIEVLEEAASTNSELAARLGGGRHVPEGHWLVANRQTSGRGRQGRTWLDGAGNFMGSTVVHLGRSDPEAASLALVAGLAVQEAVAKLLPADAGAFLKWPNDLMMPGGKLAGILLEREGDAVIVGVGVNLAAAPEVPDRPATAIAEHGDVPDRDAFAADLAACFDRELERWRNFGIAPVMRRWLASAHPEGTPLRVTEPDGSTHEGEFAGLTEAGALQLRLADGAMRVIHAGDVVTGAGQG